MTYLLRVPHRWFAVGLFLGIPYESMVLFRQCDNTKDSITKLVSAWIDRKYDVEACGEPSWRKLAEAVASRSGGEDCYLAENIILREHPKVVHSKLVFFP